MRGMVITRIEGEKIGFERKKRPPQQRKSSEEKGAGYVRCWWTRHSEHRH